MWPQLWAQELHTSSPPTSNHALWCQVRCLLPWHLDQTSAERFVPASLSLCLITLQITYITQTCAAAACCLRHPEDFVRHSFTQHDITTCSYSLLQHVNQPMREQFAPECPEYTSSPRRAYHSSCSESRQAAVPDVDWMNYSQTFADWFITPEGSLSGLVLTSWCCTFSKQQALWVNLWFHTVLESKTTKRWAERKDEDATCGYKLTSLLFPARGTALILEKMKVPHISLERCWDAGY